MFPDLVCMVAYQFCKFYVKSLGITKFFYEFFVKTLEIEKRFFHDLANFSATQILREISFGKSKASERTILTYVDEALVSQNLLDSKCHAHLFFELYQKYITKFTHLSIVAD